MEDIEGRESRDPKDVDIVTFYELPENLGETDSNQLLDLFDPEKTRDDYGVDARGIQLRVALTKETVEYISYWHTMWTHRTDGTWKGVVEVDLDSRQDTAARQILDARIDQRGWV